MQYGVNNAPKVLRAKHEQAYPKGERCPWCPTPQERPAVDCWAEMQADLAQYTIWGNGSLP